MSKKDELWRKLIEGISYKGEGSERRIVTAIAVPVLLILTIFDTFYNCSIRIDILSAWFGYLGWNGYRTLKEKKIENESSNS